MRDFLELAVLWMIGSDGAFQLLNGLLFHPGLRGKLRSIV